MKYTEQARSKLAHEHQGPEELLANFLNPMFEGRRLFAEVWGTFLLVLVAAGAKIVGAHHSDVSLGMQVTAPGLMVMAIIYFMGSVSGAHLNPAVTFAFAVRRNFPWIRVPGYILAQLSGALLAALFLKYLFGVEGKFGATTPGEGIAIGKAFLTEVILTAGLVNTILGTASGARNIGHNGAIAVGGYIVLAGLWADHLSGASMNPARSLGPDLIRGQWDTTWIYITGPLLGALMGVAFEWILKGNPTLEGTRTAQGDSHPKPS
jgi:aquaporin Z